MVLEYAPHDSLFHLPLPIIPDPDLPPPILKSGANVERLADWHHAFYPRTVLTAGDAGYLALRHCRQQWVMFGPHHDKYHPKYDAVVLPPSEEQEFMAVAAALANYVPEEGVDLSGKVPFIRCMTDNERRVLQESRQLRYERPEVVLDFLVDFMLARERDSLRPKIDELLHTKSFSRRLDVGLSIASFICGSVVKETGFGDNYARARERGLLPASALRRPKDFVRWLVFPDWSDQVAQKLRGRIETSAAA